MSKITSLVLLSSVLLSSVMVPVNWASAPGANDTKPNEAAKQQASSTRDPLLETAEITNLLSQIFESHQLDDMQLYILQLAEKINLRTYAIKHMAELEQGKSVRVVPYAISVQGAKEPPAITLVLPPSFRQGDFLAKMKDKTQAVCVILDGFSSNPIPIEAAENYLTHWQAGFVARLTVASYVEAFDEDGTALIKGENLEFSVDNQILAERGALLTIFTDPAKYYPEEFSKSLSMLMRSHNLAAAGLLHGWNASGRIEAMRIGAASERARHEAVQRLLVHRFTSEEMGALTSFTLNYLVGFAKSMAAAKAVSADAKNSAPNVDLKIDPKADAKVAYDQAQGQANQQNAWILDQVAKDRRSRDLSNLTTGFAELLFLEATALSLYTAPNGATKEMQGEWQGEMLDFIRGWNRGTSEAADEVFQVIFSTAYMKGFGDGFRSGYEQGYASGWRDGYAAGYAKAWQEANVVINSLQSELNGLRQDLNATHNALGLERAHNRTLRDQLQASLASGKRAGGALGHVKRVFKTGKAVIGKIRKLKFW